MTTRLEITPDNVRSGAGKIASESDTVGSLVAPDPTSARAGLTGFATGAVLEQTQQAIAQSITVVSARFDEMQQLLHRAANDYEHTEHKNAQSLSLADRASTALQSLGDMNSAR